MDGWYDMGANPWAAAMGSVVPENIKISKYLEI